MKIQKLTYSFNFKSQKGKFVQERTEKTIPNITLKNGRAVGEDGTEYKGVFYTTNKNGDDISLRFWYDGSLSSSKINGKTHKVILDLYNGQKAITKFLPDGREEKIKITYQENGFPLKKIQTVKTQIEEQEDGSTKIIDGYELLTTYFENGRPNTIIKSVDGRIQMCKQFDEKTGEIKSIITHNID